MVREPRRAIAILCLVIGIFVARLAAGEPAANPDVEARRAEAKSHFLRGLELGEKQAWHAALAEFLASRELFPTRAALRNVAFSLRQLGRYAESFDRYRELRADPALPEDERAALDAALAELAPRIGQLGVVSNVADAVVTVDGEDRGRGPLRVNSGLHIVRVVKEGYEPFQAEVTIAGGQNRLISATLLKLSQLARLEVHEAEGRRLQVLLDGTAAGLTPYDAPAHPGRRSVALRGPDRLGTAPVGVELRAGQTFVLTLRAVELDADVRIEPTPINARIEVDGVPLGAGIWEGRLGSGEHTLEVYAEGRLPHRERVRLRRGPQVLRIRLERDSGGRLWSIVDPHKLRLELSAGPAFAPSLGGGADTACSDGACQTRDRPFGALAVFRAAYDITPRNGFELLVGYLHLRETTQRRTAIRTNTLGVRYDVPDYEDQTRVSAPFAGIALSQRFFDRFPLTARISTGAARARVRTAVRGTFNATIPYTPAEEMSGEYSVEYSQRAGLLERPQYLWIPFMAGEVRFGYRPTKHWTLDVGLAAFFLFSPSYARKGGLYGGDDRSFNLPSGDSKFSVPDDSPGIRYVPVSTLSLPKQDALGTMLAVSPSIGVRYQF